MLARRAVPARTSMILIVGATLLAATPSHAARGLDSAFGYEWRDTIDGATYDAIAFDPSVTFVTPLDNGPPLGPVALPFSFPFYGTLYGQIWISDNGWVTFNDPAGTPFRWSQALPAPSSPNALLAPFWTDLDLLGPGRIGYGPDPTGTIERVQYEGIDPFLGTPVDFDVLAWESGCIQFQYRTSQSLALASVGIEDSPGTDAASAVDAGRPHDGVTIFPGQAIEFLPPPSIDLACVTATTLPCGTTGGTSPIAGANVSTYCCGESGYFAHEAVYSFTLTEPTVVDLLLTAGSLTMFLLDSCNEHACLGAPTTATTLLLGAGTYYVIVDGFSAADEGPFTLALSCTRYAAPLACPGADADTTAGGTSRWDAYACAPGRDLSGPEAAYAVTLSGTGNISATLTSPGLDLDVLVLRAGAGTIGSEDCVAWGDTSVTASDLPAGQYLVVVDGFAGAEGAYTLDLTCALTLTCAPNSGTINLGTLRAQTLSGNTTGGTNSAQTYPGSALVHDGPENVYELILSQPGHVVVVPTSLDPGLSVFIADSCNEGTCVGMNGGGTCAMNLEAGTHYLVVDGVAGAAGRYVLRVAYEEPFRRWTACERPAPGTSAADASSTTWNFNDGAFCWTEPGSYNFPDGCTFAMYVNVPCGGSPHLAHFDSESGHLRVFDVLAGQYAGAAAVSGGGWFQGGPRTDIEWQTSDCVTGLDPNYDNVTVDVWLDAPAAPCGIFRIEYVNHSGSQWNLSGGCGSGGPPGVSIHDSLATAVGLYSALPLLGITAASAVANCPDVTVSYSVTNSGCTAARDVAIELTEGATPVATDLVTEILPGETVSRSFPATLGTGVVMLEVDPANLVVECHEVAGAACSVPPGTRVYPLPGCGPPCMIVPRLTVTPSPACEGDALVVSGAGSISASCPGGVLEYQLSDGGTILARWQLADSFLGLFATSTTDFTLEVRCQAGPTCMDATVEHLDVELPPLFDAASVQAVDRSTCNLRVRLSWDPATFRGPTGFGVYNIYRSTLSFADAVLQAPYWVGIASTSWTDSDTSAGTTYYYVIEAEDATPCSACRRGASYGGAATRIDAPVVTDVADPRPDLLPRIAGRLRLGGTGGYSASSVDLRWGTDVPITPGAGEHFHVMRSSAPGAGFSGITVEPPRLQAEVFVDSDASRTPGALGTFVWYYRAFTVDDCENHNAPWDSI